MRFYDKFSQVVHEKNISYYQAAKEMHISALKMNLWSDGMLYPSKRDLKKISDYSGLPMSYWLCEDELDKRGRIKRWIWCPVILLIIGILLCALLISIFGTKNYQNYELDRASVGNEIFNVKSNGDGTISIYLDRDYEEDIYIPEYLECTRGDKTKKNYKVTGLCIFTRYNDNRKLFVSQYISSIELGSIGGYSFVFGGVEVDARNPYYDSRLNSNAIFETRTNTLVFATKAYDSSIVAKTIGSYCFWQDQNEVVFVPTGVETIQERAYYNSYMKKLILPETIKCLEEESFVCFSLRDVYLPSSMTYLDENAFALGFSLKHIYYKGTASEFSKICEDSEGTVTPYVYYYSETEPIDAGQYWHYSSDGEFVIW